MPAVGTNAELMNGSRISGYEDALLTVPLVLFLGFAGFRITHPLNTPGHFDEVATFLGASYFRALGKGHAYGLSARGLALERIFRHRQQPQRPGLGRGCRGPPAASTGRRKRALSMPAK